jgi:cytoskeletal protein CcmA (bactofilin family)
MSRPSDYAKRILGRSWDKAIRVIRTYSSVGEQKQPLRTQAEEQPRIAEEYKQTPGTRDEGRPRITEEEKKPMEPESRAIASLSLEEMTRIGKSVFIKGELTGQEDLTIDGRVEGKIELKDHHLVIGPNGKTQAEIQAKNVTVEGSVVGNISAGGLVTIHSPGSVVGNISAARIAINEGAHFKGSVDILLKAESAQV